MRRHTLLNNKIIGEKVRGVMMEVNRSIDIDTEEDLELADVLLRKVQKARFD